MEAIENKEQEPDYGQIHFAWHFSEFPQYQRTKSWYTTCGIVVVLMLLFSLFTGNFLFTLIVLMAAMMVMLFQRSQQNVDFKITEDGIAVNDRFYEYKDIRNFYIIYEPPQVKTLYFEPKSIFNPRIPIHLDNQDPLEVREVLKQYLTEDLNREDEPLSDQLSRLLKL